MLTKNILLALAAVGTLSMMQGVQGTYYWWSCPSIQLEPSFNLNSYSGIWYEHLCDNAIRFNDGGDCTQAKYTQSTGNTITVRNSQRSPSFATVNKVKTGKGYYKNKQTPELYVKISFFGGGSYEVVSTDHTNYAIVRSCSNFIYGLVRDEYYWILLRSTTPDATIIANAKQIIKERAPHYDVNNLQVTYQGPDCGHLS